MTSASFATFVLILASIFVISLATNEGEGARKPYIVRMVESAKPIHFASHHHWYASMLHQLSQSIELLYTYDTALHGFAATLSSAEAEVMETMDGCLAVIPSSLHQVATTHSPEFLGLAGTSGVWSKYSTSGEDIIVGVIDSGIWPESKSFNDAGLGPIPAKWKGKCKGGQNFSSANCNKKIIGAQYFVKGYEKSLNTIIDPSSEYLSPRDSSGHGTHVASIVAEAAVTVNSRYAKGTARGMAPQARLAIYKASWESGFSHQADVLAAIDKAVADGVDIISISIGKKTANLPFYKNPIALGTFGAIEHGVFVSAAAGNNGPSPSSLDNAAPWITTVGASSIDRDFPAFVRLGHYMGTYRGTSTYKGGNGKLQGQLPLVYASANDNSTCCLSGSLDRNVVEGKIVLCDYQTSEFKDKENEVARAGGVGMILVNKKDFGALQEVTTPNNGTIHNLPSISVSFRDGESIKSYIKRASNRSTAEMDITRMTVIGIRAPVVAAFSSRGPSIAYPSILKPDLIAPGVNILAALKDDYEFMSGTSMACPHVSGVAALMKAANPKWSPAAIKSALMTSSYTADNKNWPISDSYSMQPAGPFDMGAGHINPEAAVRTKLVYEIEPQDYIDYLCSVGYNKDQIAKLNGSSCRESSLEAADLNYPSFFVVFNRGSQRVEVKRTLTYMGSTPHVAYRVLVHDPPGVKISVEPRVLLFNTWKEKATYIVKFEKQQGDTGATRVYGSITWLPYLGDHSPVRSPVVVEIKSSILSLDHSSSNTTHTFALL
ncbi:hypothetical protein SUGI_0574720 [Cryptomeria japonica]|uniref:subtilisin-like protease SBT1.8 n=1 Tax=Cryptomeria japonica TaxID=3369 RepID=UPI002408CAD5|nr:subtilisin-like protease SBT1.8 [Cryptomeria japonica]GLJ29148.1 hypothetical protein SUGI_0574720 [Cryptomeria japonica]